MFVIYNFASPSARKVWIEIRVEIATGCHKSSPSARKVWIEINIYEIDLENIAVTFREEGVD